MFHPRDLDRICRDLVIQIEEELIRLGLFYRIFSRIKNPRSIEKKIIQKGENYYDGENKFLRDIIGIRIVLYFSDDNILVCNCLKRFFEIVEETKDFNNEVTFAPTRDNLIFKIPSNHIQEFNTIVNNEVIDSTFEIQLRTVLAEGWHEIDHDLRYKCSQDWVNHKDLGRSFNGILASIETSEFAILKLFDHLSYRHYKEREIIPFIRTKFRVRFENEYLSEELQSEISNKILKDIYKIDRLETLKLLFESGIIFPLSIEFIIHFVNNYYIKDENITRVIPKELKFEFDKYVL